MDKRASVRPPMDNALGGNPPKGLEASAFTFGGTEGLMLGRRGWFNAVAKRFDAGKKGMIRCCEKKWFNAK